MLLCETNVIEVGSCVIGSLVNNGNGTHTFYPGDGSDISFNTSYLASASFDSSTREVTLTMSDGTEYTYTIDVPTDTTLTIAEFADDENPTLGEVNTYLVSNPQLAGSTLAYSTPNGDYYVWIVRDDNTARLIEQNTVTNLLASHIADGAHDALDIAGNMDIAGSINLLNNQPITIENSSNVPATLATLDATDVFKFGNDVINVDGIWVGIGTASPASRFTIAQAVDNANNGLTINPVVGDDFRIYIDGSNNVQFRKNAVDILSISNNGETTFTEKLTLADNLDALSFSGTSSPRITAAENLSIRPANILTVYSDGAEAFRVGTDQKVQIGATSGSGQLNVVSKATTRESLVVTKLVSQTANLFVVEDESNSGYFTIDSSGDVDIQNDLNVTGLATFNSAVEVAGPVTIDGSFRLPHRAIHIYEDGTGIEGIRLQNTSAANDSGAIIEFSSYTSVINTQAKGAVGWLRKNTVSRGDLILAVRGDTANANVDLSAHQRIRLSYDGTNYITGDTAFSDDLTVTGGTNLGGNLNVGTAAAFGQIDLNETQFAANPVNVNNIKIGAGTYPNWSGSYTVAVGTNAGGAATISGSTTLIGGIAGYAATLNNSVGVGYYALRESSATLTTAIGNFAGYLSTANNCVYLGYNMGRSNTVNGTLEIGAYETFPIISGTMSNAAIQELSLNANTVVGGIVEIGDTTGLTPNTNADDLVVANSSSSGISILTTGIGDTNLFFGDTASAVMGGFTYRHSTNEMFVRVGGGVRWTYASNGDLSSTGADLNLGANLTINGNFKLVSPTVPANAAAAGTAGQIAWDGSYIYVCTAANTWVRAALSTW